jgi:hypothetical protein
MLKIRKLQDQKDCLRMMASYKSRDEIDDIQMQSDAKISNAKRLHHQIAALKKDPAFLDKEAQSDHRKLIAFHNSFQGSFPTITTL